jgi:hypothetical protein
MRRAFDFAQDDKGWEGGFERLGVLLERGIGEFVREDCSFGRVPRRRLEWVV